MTTHGIDALKTAYNGLLQEIMKVRAAMDDLIPGWRQLGPKGTTTDEAMLYAIKKLADDRKQLRWACAQIKNLYAGPSAAYNAANHALEVTQLPHDTI